MSRIRVERLARLIGVARYCRMLELPVDYVFGQKKALRCHQLRSRLHGHGLQTSTFASVITNSSPWCRSTFATTLIARKHTAAALLSGHCKVDAGAFPWPISPPLSLQCRLCDDGDSYASINVFLRSCCGSPFAQAISCQFTDRDSVASCLRY